MAGPTHIDAQTTFDVGRKAKMQAYLNVGAIALVAISGCGLIVLAYLRIYNRGFDDGWVHRHLGGERRPWSRGQAWKGNGLTLARTQELELEPYRESPPPQLPGEGWRLTQRSLTH
jgi:hypothetical protein